MRIAAKTALALLVSASALAQDEAGRKVAVEVAARMPFEQAQKGAPYSAETVIESSQTLADGNRINRKTTGRVYRDGEGRTRREEDREFTAVNRTGGASSAIRTTISIVDPVAGFSYSLDPENKIAWKTPIGTAGSIISKLEAAAVTERRKLEIEKMQNEKLANLTEEEKVAMKQEIEKANARGGGGGRGGRVVAPRPDMAPAIARSGGGGRGGNASVG